MPENRVQFIIEVNTADGTARIKAIGDSFAKLQGQAAALSGEYGKLSGAAGKTSEEKKKLADASKQASAGMDRASASSMSLAAAVNSLAGAIAAWKALEMARETALLAARVETLGVVMGVVGQNALYSRTEMDAYADAVRKMGITTQESRQTVTRMAQAHLDLGKASELARVAQDAAVIANQNSSEALQGLMHGIATLQPEILRTYGIIVNFEQEYAKFAAAAGRTVDSLSAQEKQQIALNAVLEAGKGIAGSYEAAMGTVGKQINSLPRLIEEAKLKIGELFTPALQVMVQEFTKELAQLDKYLSQAAANGDMKRWAGEIAGSVRDGIAALKELAENVKAAIEILKPFAGTAAEMLVLGYVAEKALAAARAITAFAIEMRAAQAAALGMNTAIKGTLPLLAFLAAYEAAKWLSSWADGTRQVERETAALNETLKRQQAELRRAEAAAREKGEAQRLAEETYTRQYEEEIRKLVAADSERNAAERKKREDALRRQAEQDRETLKKWEKEKALIGKNGLERELAVLEEEYKAYARVVEDKIALERMFAEKRREIELKAKNEFIALNEELYQATANQAYAQAAIEAMKSILDAEEEKWAKILESDDDAHALRLKREQQYVDKIKGLIRETTEAAREAAVERQQISLWSPETGGYQSQVMMSEHGLGEITGRSTGLMVPVSWVNNYTTVNYNTQRANEAAAQAARIAEQIAQENERLAQEYQREYESRVNTLEGLRGQVASFTRERERRTWGAAEYTLEFTRLGEEFAKAADFETSAGLFEEMLDVLQELDSIEQQALEEQKRITESLQEQKQSISDWLVDLSQGTLSPVQSAEGWASRFEELRQQAMTDESKVAEFLNYAKSYLEFEKAYGDSDSYKAVYQSVTSSVSGLGDYMDLASILANLGLGDSLSDINALIGAFESMGITAQALKAAAESASGSTGSLADILGIDLTGATGSASGSADALSNVMMGTQTPFTNVTNALNSMGSGVATKITEVSGFFSTLATQLGLTYNDANLNTAVTTLTPVPYSPPSLSSAWTSGGWASGDRWKWTYIPTGRAYYTPQDVMPTWYDGEWWIYDDPGTPWDNPGWTGLTSGRNYPTLPGNAKGGLAASLSFAGEIGPEWVVPTYEPERSRFLNTAPPAFWSNMGVSGGGDPEAIARALAAQIRPLVAALSSSGAGGELHIHLNVDGRELASVIAGQYRQGHKDLIEQTRRRIQ